MRATDAVGKSFVNSNDHHDAHDRPRIVLRGGQRDNAAHITRRHRRELLASIQPVSFGRGVMRRCLATTGCGAGHGGVGEDQCAIDDIAAAYASPLKHLPPAQRGHAEPSAMAAVAIVRLACRTSARRADTPFRCAISVAPRGRVISGEILSRYHRQMPPIY